MLQDHSQIQLEATMYIHSMYRHFSLSGVHTEHFREHHSSNLQQLGHSCTQLPATSYQLPATSYQLPTRWHTSSV